MTQPEPEIPNLAGLQQDLSQLTEPGRTLTLLAEQSGQVASQRGATAALPGLLLGLDGIADMAHGLTQRLTREFPAMPVAAGRRLSRRECDAAQGRQGGAPNRDGNGADRRR